MDLFCRVWFNDTRPSGLAQQVPVRRKKLQMLPEWFSSCLMTRYQLHQLRGNSITSQTVCTAIWWNIIWVSSIRAAIMMRWLFPGWRLLLMIPKIMIWGFPKRSMKGQKNLHWINCFSSTSQQWRSNRTIGFPGAWYEVSVWVSSVS